MDTTTEASAQGTQLLRAVGADQVAAWVDAHPASGAIIGVAAVMLLCLATLALTRGLLLRVTASVARRSSITWDDLLIEHRVFHRISWSAPALVVHQLIDSVPYLPNGVAVALQRLALCALVVIGLLALGAAFNASNAIYATFPMARNRPIKGYLQVVLIVAWIFGIVSVAAILMDRSPWLLLSGLGAMTAILLLVFRDTLLSLVAGVQLTSNDLIRLGDWIEMPQFAADGDVVDIGLHAVKVQNWDRTITVIPTHRFLEHSFKNWRGMTESGGRRIKRAFHVDMSTIRFLEEEEVERFGRFVLLRDYIAQKKQELADYNRQHETPGMVANARRLTNVGTLRAWIVAYLRQHPKVHQEMTFLVRQLAPTPEGLPIEIYVFCNDIRWAEYERVQADIFDHVLAVVPQFGLRTFQSPSGADVVSLTSAGRSAEALRRAASAQESTAAPVAAGAEASRARNVIDRGG